MVVAEIITLHTGFSLQTDRAEREKRVAELSEQSLKLRCNAFVRLAFAGGAAVVHSCLQKLKPARNKFTALSLAE